MTFGVQEVLIVVDREVEVKMLSSVVEEIGDVRAVGFTIASAALQWAEVHEPALVLLDYRMPGLDGIAFLERFRNLPGKGLVPVVIITADPEHSVRHRALELGATDYLTKPFDVVEVRARARNLIELHRCRMEVEEQALFLTDRAAYLRAQIKRATKKLADQELETILYLARTAEFRDRHVGTHILRVGAYSAAIARRMGMSPDDVELIEMAAPMHDLGKMATPDAILFKPGPLTPDEWAIMRQHAPNGFSFLKDSRSAFLREGALIAHTHHERFDGSGYPQGLREEDIPLSGRICAITDVFDALTAWRPYKESWPVEAAVDYILRTARSHFDPTVTSAFERSLDDIAAIAERLRDPDAPRIAAPG